MVGIGDGEFWISSRGWTPRGHRIWAVFDRRGHPDQVAIIAAKHDVPRRKYHEREEFVDFYNVVNRLPWEPSDPDDPLQLEIMARYYPKEG